MHLASQSAAAVIAYRGQREWRTKSGNHSWLESVAKTLTELWRDVESGLDVEAPGTPQKCDAVFHGARSEKQLVGSPEPRADGEAEMIEDGDTTEVECC
jgi:hypothetical protein